MLRYKTELAWFSRLVRHPARKRSGSILTTPEGQLHALVIMDASWDASLLVLVKFLHGEISILVILLPPCKDWTILFYVQILRVLYPSDQYCFEIAF